MERILKREIQRLFPILEAIKEGKTIQWRDTGMWRDIDGDNEGFCLDTMTRRTDLYRIKPEPKYRPFKTVQECLSEMQKHQPFGWLKDKNKDSELRNIQALTDEMLTIADGVYFHGIRLIDEYHIFEDAIKEYTFADGTPFGILEDF